jgi:uncharacterized protein YodC (DUF2158 family)
MAFKPGTQVRHVTGGPAMVVTSSDDESTECEWYDARETFHERSFATVALVEHTPAPDRMRSGQV